MGGALAQFSPWRQPALLRWSGGRGAAGAGAPGEPTPLCCCSSILRCSSAFFCSCCCNAWRCCSRTLGSVGLPSYAVPRSFSGMLKVISRPETSPPGTRMTTAMFCPFFSSASVFDPISISAEQAFWKHMSYLPSSGSFLSMMTRKPGLSSMPIGRIRKRNLRFSSPDTSKRLMLIIGGWSAEVEKSRIVAHASRPFEGSLAQNLAHCGSGDTRSIFDGGAGACWAGAPGAAGAAGAAGFSGFVCANAAPASATLIASAAPLKRMTGNLINRPFEP